MSSISGHVPIMSGSRVMFGGSGGSGQVSGTRAELQPRFNAMSNLKSYGLAGTPGS